MMMITFTVPEENGRKVLTMPEYIEREELQAALVRKQCGPANQRYTDGWHDCLLRVKSMVSKAPAANVAPVRHGLWIHSRYKDCSEQFELVKCSQCNHEAYAMAFYVRGGNYCPNCGAKMDEEDV